MISCVLAYLEGRITGSADDDPMGLLNEGPVLDIKKPREKHNTPTANRGALSTHDPEELDFELEEPPGELELEVDAYRTLGENRSRLHELV